jgi:hypothetical protein
MERWRFVAPSSLSKIKEGKDEMTKASMNYLRRRIYVKAKAEKCGRAKNIECAWKDLNSVRLIPAN